MLSFYLTCSLLLTLVVFVSVIYSCVKVSVADSWVAATFFPLVSALVGALRRGLKCEGARNVKGPKCCAWQGWESACCQPHLSIGIGSKLTWRWANGPWEPVLHWLL